MKKIILSIFLFLFLSPQAFSANIEIYTSSVDSDFSFDYGNGKYRNFSIINDSNDISVYDEQGNFIVGGPGFQVPKGQNVFVKLNGDIIFFENGNQSASSYEDRTRIYYYKSSTDEIFYSFINLNVNFPDKMWRMAIVDGDLIFRYINDEFQDTEIRKIDLSDDIVAHDFLESYTGALTNGDIPLLQQDTVVYEITDNIMGYRDDNEVFNINCVEDFSGVCTESVTVDFSGFSIFGFSIFGDETIDNYFMSSNGVDNTVVSVAYDSNDTGEVEYFSSFTAGDTFQDLYIYNIDWSTNTYNFHAKSILDSTTLPVERDFSILFYAEDDGNSGTNYFYQSSGVGYVMTENSPFVNTGTSTGTSGGGGSGTGTLTSTGSIDIPDISEWTFSTSGYAFYDFGFTLQNFVPNPFGGQLDFEILRPDGTTYIADDVRYGFDVNPIVGFDQHSFAHNEVGEYQVRVSYSYGGLQIYPFGEDYNTYTIIQPTTRSEWDPNDYSSWDVQTCDDGNEDDSFLAGISNFFICTTDLIGGAFSGLGDIMVSILGLFDEIGKLFTTEEADLFGWIIPQASANVEFNPIESAFNGASGTESFIDDVKSFWYGILLLVLLLVTLILLILSRN